MGAVMELEVESLLSTLTYTYDALGRLDTIPQGVPGDPIADYAYVSQSPHLVASVALNDGAYSVTNTWEPYRDILDTKLNKAGATTISSYDYSVNTQGQRTSVAMSGTAFTGTPSWGWTYNDTGEVIAAEHSATTSYNRAYEYDGLGNRKKSSSGATDPVDYPWLSGTVRAYTRNTLNQYTGLTNPSASPVHDVDGNLTDDGTKLYEWDAENRLIKVKRKSDSAVLATYTYDYLGRRVRKETTGDALQGASDILYLYDGWNLVAEYTNGGTPALARSYVWGLDLSGSLQGAGGVGGLLRVTDHAGPTHYFPTYDGNGNVSEYLTGAGTVSTHFEYDAFGNVANTPASPTSANFRFQFSTKQVGRETGFSYYGFRYLDPVTGRWISRDPTGETGGVNLVAILTNAPLNDFDILGFGPGKGKNPPGAVDPDSSECSERRAKQRQEISDFVDSNKSDSSPDCSGEAGCTLITFVVELGDPCDAIGWRSVGHSGVGIGDDFYDFGPAGGSGGFNRPGGTYWDDRFGPGLSDVLGNIGLLADEHVVIKVEYCACNKTTTRMREYWDKLYSDFPEWGLGGLQCTNAICHSLGKIGTGYLSPEKFLRKRLGKLRSECGVSKGAKPYMSIIN